MLHCFGIGGHSCLFLLMLVLYLLLLSKLFLPFPGMGLLLVLITPLLFFVSFYRSAARGRSYYAAKTAAIISMAQQANPNPRPKATDQTQNACPQAREKPWKRVSICVYRVMITSGSLLHTARTIWLATLVALIDVRGDVASKPKQVYPSW